MNNLLTFGKFNDYIDCPYFILNKDIQNNNKTIFRLHSILISYGMNSLIWRFLKLIFFLHVHHVNIILKTN